MNNPRKKKMFPKNVSSPLLFFLGLLILWGLSEGVTLESFDTNLFGVIDFERSNPIKYDSKKYFKKIL